MSKHFIQSAALRGLALAGLRAVARSQVWRTGPKIFVNSIPKAGTHLVTAELKTFPQLQNSWLHIETRQVNRLSVNQSRVSTVDIDKIKFQKLCNAVRSGQFFTAHLFYDPIICNDLQKRMVKTLFVTRDPRDVLISNLHYITKLKRHFLHKFFTETLRSDDDRLDTLVRGTPGPPFVRSLRDTLAAYVPWIGADGVLTIRFEDLVGSRGGGDDEARKQTLIRIASHCGLNPTGIAPTTGPVQQSTPTLRLGRAYGWHQFLPKHHSDLILNQCGALIAQMGYRTDIA